ncbi:MAG: adenylate/guanylate cyclase domain-containing protein [Burkholderiaceae bacterium]
MNELARWLDELGLGRYGPAFERHRIDEDLLADLTDRDLREIGIDALGDRKRLLKAIEHRVARAGRAAAPQHANPATHVPLGTPGSDAHSPDAPRALERRQLTVMFCDLVGSTELAARLDPEDLREVVRSYHGAVAQAVAPHLGFVAQLLGDGVLVYFGYPRAHEDDAVRAVRSALSVIDAVRGLRTPLGAPLQARVGIATGPVVVGELGVGTSAVERTASGETPNRAARLQAVARPGDVVIAEQTRRLVGAAFDMESLGTLHLKGLPAPVEAWRVIAKREVETRFEALRPNPPRLFVGRDAELAMLAERWERSCAGESQVVLVTGEAGIGKSRICRVLRERVCGPSTPTVVLQGSPDHASSSLYPFVRALERLARIEDRDPPPARAAKLSEWLGGFGFGPGSEQATRLASHLGLAGGAAPGPAESPQLVKAKTLSAFAELIGSRADAAPALVLVEDAHWIDPTSEELLGVLLTRLRRSKALVLVTCRPEYERTWGSPANLTQLVLGRLSHQHSSLLAAATAGEIALSAGVASEIVRKTDGIPLFVEELTRSVIEAGRATTREHGADAAGPERLLAIPASLHDSLMARLDRLGPAKEVAQAAAVIGREFPVAIVQSVLGEAREHVQRSLARLEQAGLIARRAEDDASAFTFRHALIRDTAYQSIVRGRRLAMHRHVANAIASSLGDRAAEQQELLGEHFFNAECWRKAIECLSAAAQRAASKAAFAEAAASLQRALQAVAMLPHDEPARRLELRLLFRLNDALLPICRYDRLQSALDDAELLASELDDGAARSRVWSCQAHFQWIARGRNAAAADYARRSLAAGPDEGRREREIPTRFYLGQIEHSAGRLTHSVEAYEALDRLIASSSKASRFEHFFSVTGRGWSSFPLSDLGRFELAIQRCAHAYDVARTSGDSLLQIPAALGTVYAHLCLGDHARAIEAGEDALDRLRTMGDLPQWLIPLGSHVGAALVRDGQVERGVALLERCWALHASAGLVGHQGWNASLVAEGHLVRGDVERAREKVADALRISGERDEAGYRALALAVSAETIAAGGEDGFAPARERLAEALRISRSIGHRVVAARCVVDLGWIARRCGRGDDLAPAEEDAGQAGQPFRVFSTLTRGCVPFGRAAT